MGVQIAIKTSQYEDPFLPDAVLATLSDQATSLTSKAIEPTLGESRVIFFFNLATSNIDDIPQIELEDQIETLNDASHIPLSPIYNNSALSPLSNTPISDKK